MKFTPKVTSSFNFVYPLIWFLYVLFKKNKLTLGKSRIEEVGFSYLVNLLIVNILKKKIKNPRIVFSKVSHIRYSHGRCEKPTFLN